MQDQAFGNAAGADDLAVVVDIVQEGVERAGALLQSAAQALPFGLRQHARNEVERNQAFGIAAFGIDGEGDADAAEQHFGLASLERKLVGGTVLSQSSTSA